MEAIASPLEPTVIRQVFALWSMRIPASFEETFVHGDDYWHGWDADRSVSMTSIIVTDRGRPVGVRELLRTMSATGG